MAITIKGVRIEALSIKRLEETGGHDVGDAQYSLISSTDHVLAKQSIGSYGGLTLKPSANTVKALREFMTLYHADVVAVLGLE